jgi:hypothetical protein
MNLLLFVPFISLLTLGHAQKDGYLRKLPIREDEKCSSVIAQNTTFNAVDFVPAYEGIMFEVFSKGDPLEILTLEINVRLDNTSDLFIEVYSLTGKYELVMDDESAWTLHAQTTAVPAPEGNGVIIPRQHFTPIRMEAMERRSLYVRMNGPWIENNVDALMKTGEIFMKAPDLVFYTGIGLNSKFPSDFDKKVDPQFSGVIYYLKEHTCDKTAKETTANFEFLIMLPVTRFLMNEVDRIINEALDSQITISSKLKQFTVEYGFKRLKMATSKAIPFTSTCPMDWESCGNAAVSTTVSFVHSDTLDSRLVLEELYTLNDVIGQALIDDLKLTQIMPVGMETVWADFEIIVRGVPQGQTMDAMQQGLFKDSMLQFLSTTVAARSSYLEIYNVQVKEQTTDGDISNSESSIQLRGTVSGAQHVLLPLENFPLQIESGLEENKGFYLSLLRATVSRPYTVDDAGLSKYFDSVSSVEGRFVVGDDPNPNDSVLNIRLIVVAIGIGILAFVALLIGLYYVYRHLTGQTLHDEELIKDQRKKSKQAGMQRRQVKKNDGPSVCGTDVDGLSWGNESSTSFDSRLEPSHDMSKSKDYLRTAPGRSRSDSAVAMPERPAFRGMRPNTGQTPPQRSKSDSHLDLKGKMKYARDNSKSDLRASLKAPASSWTKERAADGAWRREKPILEGSAARF